MKTIDEILNLLPKSYDEVNLDMYKRLMVDVDIADDQKENLPADHITGFNGYDNTLRMASVITDTPIEEIEALPLRDINAIGAALEFTTKLPTEIHNNLIKWKELDDVTYGDWKIWQKIEPTEQLRHLETFVGVFSKNGFTDEEILKLPIGQITGSFFFTEKEVIKTISEAFNQVSAVASGQGQSKKPEEKDTMQTEGFFKQGANRKTQIEKLIGWERLAHQVSLYANCSYFEILNQPAIEIAGLAMVMVLETQLAALSR